MKFDLKKSRPDAAGGRDGKGSRPPAAPGKRYAIQFSRAGLIGFGVVALIGLVWIFIFGILVGRGYRPETAVPELARIVPSQENKTVAAAPPAILQADELSYYENLRKGVTDAKLPPVQTRPAAASGGLDATMHPLEEDMPPGGPLQDAPAPAKPSGVTGAPAASPKHQPDKAAEKSLAKAPEKAPAKPADKLAEKPLTPAPAPAPAPAQAPAQALAQPPAKPVEKPVLASLKQPSQGAASPAPAPAPKELLSDDEKGDPNQRYAYVYQAGAFSEADKAADFRKQVQSLNLKAGVQKVEDGGKTWHRVMVYFDGKPEDTRALKEKLKQVGVAKALLRSKKPI